MVSRISPILLATLVVLLGLSQGAAGQIAVIGHPAVLADTLDQATLLDVYAGELNTWPDRQPIRVYDLKERAPVKEAFYRFLGKTTSQMKSVWMKKLLLGESEPPAPVTGEAEMAARVAATPGAIGYVRAGSAAAAVKILLLIPAETLP
jgi:ABC-type phosphate transport system substrate-binding protein